jgi:hypothetical protein
MKEQILARQTELIKIAKQHGFTDTNHEDEAIAFCLNHSELVVRAEGFACLREKYTEIVCEYVAGRFKKLSASARDMIVDKTFDRIWQFTDCRKVKTTEGSLGGLVTLICEWGAREIWRTEDRRARLLRANFQKLWCIQREEAEEYRGNEITERDLEELVAAIQRSVNPYLFPGTAEVLRALSFLYLRRNGMQVQGLAPSPSLSGIVRYLEANGTPMSEQEVQHCLKILRSKTKAVLEENGWEIDLPVSKCA